jgi:hypothetical protein
VRALPGIRTWARAVAAGGFAVEGVSEALCALIAVIDTK